MKGVSNVVEYGSGGFRIPSRTNKTEPSLTVTLSSDTVYRVPSNCVGGPSPVIS